MYRRDDDAREAALEEWLVIDVHCQRATAQLLGARKERRRMPRADAIYIHDNQGQVWAWELLGDLLEFESGPRQENFGRGF